MKTTFAKIGLIFLLIVQIISAIPAGLLLLIDPSGAKLGLPLDMLEVSPFNSYFIPGLFLFLILGVLPIVIVIGLIKKWNIKIFEKLNLYRDYHWSWTFSFYFGMVLIIWVNMELLFIKEYSFLQVMFSMLGVAIIVLTQLPVVKQAYKIKGA